MTVFFIYVIKYVIEKLVNLKGNMHDEELALAHQQ